MVEDPLWYGNFKCRTKLVVCKKGYLAALHYMRDILESNVPFVGNMGPAFTLHHDNASLCAARMIVNNFLNDRYIETMAWPANSPDLIPIEHHWNILERRLLEYQPIVQVLLQEWNFLAEPIKNLIESIPGRFAEVIRARRGHSRY